SRTCCTTVKIAMVAPIASDSVRIVAVAKPGERRIARAAWRVSCTIVSNMLPLRRRGVLVAQRFDRIDVAGAARRHVAGSERREGDHEDHAYVDDRIARVPQERGGGREGEGDGRCEADGAAVEHRTSAVAEHHADDAGRRRTQRKAKPDLARPLR